MSNVGNVEETALRGLQEFMDLALALWDAGCEDGEDKVVVGAETDSGKFTVTIQKVDEFDEEDELEEWLGEYEDDIND